MKLAWTPEARADRRAIYIYIEAENASAAIALDELFAKRSKQLMTHPMTGRPGRVSGHANSSCTETICWFMILLMKRCA
ncbi:type II toxin-antitoxin system RelE/ParE family toxin [Rhizobium sp. CNPSo 3968]|nr:MULTISPECIES: type II toxin-antitoxin system RelE/ParE family toxin [Rhizobium]MDK4721420.1 type II toxin-antitoxin system RelE/ParE family toxin [Rhizobium sp. CNPSo 3968]